MLKESYMSQRSVPGKAHIFTQVYSSALAITGVNQPFSNLE